MNPNLSNVVSQAETLIAHEITLTRVEDGATRTLHAATRDPGVQDLRGLLDLVEAWNQLQHADEWVVTGIVVLGSLVVFPHPLDATDNGGSHGGA